MRYHRSVTGVLAGASALLLLTGCAAETSDTGGSSEPEGSFTYALVTPGAAGDGSFIDASIRGVERAEEELGVSGAIVEAESVAQQESVLRSTVATRPDIILAPGLDEASLLAVANENPEQLFGVPSDIYVDELPSNVQAFTINVHTASYLGGYVAGSLTQTGTVGAVLGQDNPGLNQFYYGYLQGALAACGDCTVLPSYLNGEFGDPSVGQEAALSQFQQGADIIYAVAGLSGQGVFTAARAEGAFAIGVDVDQDADAPGTVITSVMKRVDATTYALIESALNGEFESGFVQADMADGFSGLSWSEGSTVFAEHGPEALTSQLPDLQAEIESVRERIISGEIEVCDALNDPSSEACGALGLSG